MPRQKQELTFVAIKGCVLALDDHTGQEVWNVELPSAEFANLLFDGDALIVTNSGEVWRLDPRTGAALWHNELKGYGRGLVTLASTRVAGSANADALVEEMRRVQAAASAAATTAAS